mmetsp:Transcript_725/g.2151  ORF Transcript_725/g.2151 Transcript_725/m.2151 type:complete len:95 (+) Transcript_725:777-1061(+)
MPCCFAGLAAQVRIPKAGRRPDLHAAALQRSCPVQTMMQSLTPCLSQLPVTSALQKFHGIIVSPFFTHIVGKLSSVLRGTVLTPRRDWRATKVR